VSLHDPSGQLIGFTGRYIGEESNAPKYLNTPQTLLYDKSRHVFGLHLAKESIRKSGYAVLVEGNLDVVSSHQAGIKQVVAAAGTALTDQHLRVLKRFTANISLALDNDKAGLAATERTIPIAEQLDIRLRIITMPAGVKDPDELIRQDANLWPNAIASGVAVVDWVLNEYEQRYDLATAEGKRQFSSASLAVIKNLKDSVEQDHYLQIVAKKTGSRLSAVEEKLASLQTNESNKTLKKATPAPSLASEANNYQDALLSLAAQYPPVRGLLVELSEDDMSETRAKVILSFLQSHLQTSFSTDVPPLLHEHETYVKILLLRADARYGAWSDLDRYDETAKLVKLVKNETKQRIKQQLETQLRQAEDSADHQKVEKLKQELNKVIKEIG